jgi:outer membrane protein TolC
MKNKLKYIIVIGLLFNMAGLKAQTPLQVYQDTAAMNNPGIKSLFRQYESVMQKAPQNRTLPDPQFGFGYFINSVETRVGPQRAVFSISQAFPWFGQLGAEEQATIERAKAVLEKFNNERAQLNFNVAATYNNLYVLRSAIRITEDNILLLRTLKNLANVRFESGKGSMVDILRIEMELGELDNQLKFLEDSKRPLVAEFEQFLNSKLDQDVLLPDVLWSDELSIDKEQIMDSVKIMNPSILSLDHEIHSYERDVEAAKRIGGPSFTVGLNYTIVSKIDGYTGEGNGKDVILPTLGVKIPLYRKKYQSLVLEKEIARESIELKKTDRTNELRTVLEKTFRDYDDGVRRVALYVELERYARQALDILIAEYTSTATNFEEIIRMDRKLLKYELELEKARADQNTAYAYIGYLMGK